MVSTGNEQQDALVPALAELDVVEVLRPVLTDEGAEVPAGSHGTIVGVWSGGEGYAVEFAGPVVGLADLTPDLMRVVWRGSPVQ